MRSILDSAPLWLAASLGVAAINGGIALDEAFSAPYVVQDDARQHVFWMQSYRDPELFAGDPIAEYFRAVAPPGYAAFYRVFALIGVDPLLLAKLIPFALALLTAFLAFDLIRRSGVHPFVAFVASSILIQNLFLLDALTNATPRAFACPLFLLFLREMDRSWIGTAAAALGLAYFYPQLALVAALVLLFSLRKEQLRPAIAGTAAIGIALLPKIFDDELGPALTAEAALRMPELQPGGRSAFFDPDPIQFFLCGERSGLLPIEWCRMQEHLLGVSPILLVVPLLLLLAAVPMDRRRLFSVVAASFSLFIVAHLFLFRLHVPNRYTQQPLRILLALALGAAFARALLPLLRRAPLLAPACAALFFALPFLAQKVAWHGYVRGEHPAIYAALRNAPSSTRVATQSDEAANLPAFTGRPVLTSEEHAIPYHVEYYRQLTSRARDLARAERSERADELRAFIERHRIGAWLVALEELPRSAVLLRRAEGCTMARDAELTLLDASCLAEEESERACVD